MINNETMSEFYNGIKEGYKIIKEQREDKYTPLLLEKGAVYKSDGVYELKVNNEIYFCYPKKGYAMNKKNNKNKKLLNKLLINK